MSSNDTYTSDPNSPRWPLYAMTLLALICCIVMWRSCDFSKGDPAPAIAPADAAGTK